MALILVVEDDRHLRRVLATAIAACQHEVVTAVDGADALVRAAEVQPDMIFMDLSLPGLDGFAAARCLRTQAFARELPLIALTGSLDAKDRQRAAEAGFTAYLIKPVMLEDLRDTIASFVGDNNSLTRIGRDGVMRR